MTPVARSAVLTIYGDISLNMKLINNTTPVVIVDCKLGALAIMRSLGPLHIPLYGVDLDPWSPGMMSKYCRKPYLAGLNGHHPHKFLDELLKIGKEMSRPSILIPTSDETALFVSEYGDGLSDRFIFPRNPPKLIRQLISKKEMYELARQHKVPTPHTVFPNNLNDVLKFLENAIFPLMLKGIYGNRLQVKTGKRMVIAKSPEELITNYKLLEDPEIPNLMIQEYIPGNDDQIYIFNGYFNKESRCLAGFTGYKIRQFPVHTGCASLGECRWNEEVAKITIEFMQAIHYRGILDIGYRRDPRDGTYKVLDINPRVGQAFRLFVAEKNMDVVKSFYLDLTGQKQVPIIPREGRRWLIEDLDMISSFHYFQEGTLKFGEWIRSFNRVEESAWFSWKDPFPFMVMMARLIRKSFIWIFKKTRIRI